MSASPALGESSRSRLSPSGYPVGTSFGLIEVPRGSVFRGSLCFPQEDTDYVNHSFLESKDTEHSTSVSGSGTDSG